MSVSLMSVCVSEQEGVPDDAVLYAAFVLQFVCSVASYHTRLFYLKRLRNSVYCTTTALVPNASGLLLVPQTTRLVRQVARIKGGTDVLLPVGR